LGMLFRARSELRHYAVTLVRRGVSRVISSPAVTAKISRYSRTCPDRLDTKATLVAVDQWRSISETPVVGIRGIAHAKLIARFRAILGCRIQCDESGPNRDILVAFAAS